MDILTQFRNLTGGEKFAFYKKNKRELRAAAREANSPTPPPARKGPMHGRPTDSQIQAAATSARFRGFDASQLRPGIYARATPEPFLELPRETVEAAVKCGFTSRESADNYYSTLGGVA